MHFYRAGMLHKRFTVLSVSILANYCLIPRNLTCAGTSASADHRARDDGKTTNSACP